MKQIQQLENNNDQDIEHTQQSVNTLISISGTLASIDLALVGILSAKSAITNTETAADDLFLFSSLGFLCTLALGYVVQKRTLNKRTVKFVNGAEWVFSVSLFATILAAFLLVYTEM